MTDIDTLHQEWSQDPAYRAAHEELRPEFELATALIAARARAGLSQAELAERMGTTQSAIARLEGGRHWPSRRTLERLAAATGTRVVFKLVDSAGTAI
ncbi:helix-turn-helix domain-containing protein [Rhodospirillum rubrum]|uniref:Transcriptional regulator, XRE family n=1 Tax=Rhodospirillum rubrum (strain ATCC 11170 / ATH 1.1.1 / DSM 467 / LMG 4362 / NCIMB 8255 / S1) TaxID=269796 RepID=Q2RNU0_RHORT|nr:helix-turn-helix transcriptional regulator [Rhodospirillum rubrum]ABC24205.1 transcriptional regulator, XRE family [Rhodospirillum rubrum ATCC 11170]AEO49956.1 XRE family transcriptional regulator [Rhodospirillum rubrum F11]MBK5955923.1 transcriptional regulator [Rhodospirillum rubrum]QXG80140.1 helix-turn-helix domain-containing protein [Rhodospirillum rubrum]HAP99261.1 XRE family transcriptional regulator [Rhodospirillum rubrum]